MKTLKIIIGILIAVAFNAIVSAFLSQMTGTSFFAWFAISMVLSLIPATPKGVLRAGLNKEIWIDTLMENFYPDGSWLSGVVDMTQFVENNTINLAEIGVDPTVLVNNTTYPVPANVRTDNPLAIPLDRFDTENTIVHNAEAVELSYDKRASVIKQHKDALRAFGYRRAAQAYGPQSNAAFTPVINTTGGNTSGGQKAITIADVAKMQRLFNEAELPEEGRRAILHPIHVESLLAEDKSLFKQFVNLKEGQVLRFCGFDFFTFTRNPVYLHNTNAKKAWGAAVTGNDSEAASIFFVTSEVMMADGTYDMFIRENDPELRGDMIGFQKRFVALPMRSKGQGAIVSKP